MCGKLYPTEILLTLVSFAIRKELVVLLFLMPSKRQCSVVLPHGVVGCSVICDCGIS